MVNFLLIFFCCLLLLAAVYGIYVQQLILLFAIIIPTKIQNLTSITLRTQPPPPTACRHPATDN